jgi:phenylalanyl-tRNA synthetase alpha chain
MKSRIEDIANRFESDLNQTESNGNYDELYLKYFSKSHGITTQLVKELVDLSPDEKKIYGPLVNEMQSLQKEAIENSKKHYRNNIAKKASIDLTVPEPATRFGYLHPTTQFIRETNAFFKYYGYSIYEGPEIETAEYNFRKLNLPEGHPATDLQDSLFIVEPNILLTTHTSSIESRVLSEKKPPIRVAFPGKCFRNETPNPTNVPFFYQYQGVVVEKGITLQHLKHTLEMFHKFLFGSDVELRFRYKYYPEVSPGMGVDMKCVFCKGDGCNVCRQRGYIEVLGSGMIHYNTLKMCGIDPEVYTGFAFGMGLDRLVMQKFGIDDIRHLYGGGIVYE